MDKYTRYACTFPLKYKSEVLATITQLHTELEFQTVDKVKRTYSDRAKEYISDRHLKYYQTLGIISEYTADYSPSFKPASRNATTKLFEGILKHYLQMKVSQTSAGRS